MTTVSIIGQGSMGQAIAEVATEGGHTVEVLGRQDAGREIQGDVVVLAVPYPEVEQVIRDHRDHLAGKVVVDITNPVDLATFDSLVVPADPSAAAEIAAALPEATVVKALNTNFAATLGEGTVGPLPTTVLVAGDEASAKTTVAGVLRDGGLRVVDVGALERARELEAVGFLQLTLAAGGSIPWTGGFGVVA